MTLIDQISIISYHNERIRNYADNHKQLGWKEATSQQLRFDALIDKLDLNHASVLDVGCGYADFKTLLDKHFPGISYTGIDLVPDFVHEAARRFASDHFASFVHGDFYTTPMTEVDFVFCCGALSYRHSDPEFPYKMIRKMFYTSRKGLAFCALDKRLFPEQPILTGLDKKEIISYCKSLSRKIIINDNYLLEDFTIQIMH